MSMKAIAWSRRILIGVFLGTFAAGGAAFAGSSLATEGAELYGDFCENCHGADRQGLQAFEGDLDALTERLEGVTEEMPDFAGFFEEDEIAALYEYLSAPK